MHMGVSGPSILIESTDSMIIPNEARFPLGSRLNQDGFPKFIKCRSQLQQHHGPANLVFSVLDQIPNLLASVQARTCNIPSCLTGWLDLPRLKNCAPSLNPALLCHCYGPRLTTTPTMVDSRTTFWKNYTDNVAKTGPSCMKIVLDWCTKTLS